MKIDTLDNPGWSLTIGLFGTDAEGRTLDCISIERTESDWIFYRVEKNEFRADMGPQNLVEAIGIFLKWFENSN